MTEIEADSVSAKRKATGTAFSMNLVPPDFSRDRCVYKNPEFGLRILFEARWIYDQRVCLGIILVQGQLQRRIEDAVSQRLSRADVHNLVRDCYELIVEFIRARDERNDRHGVKPHIYEATPSQFEELASPVQVSRDAVVTSGAVQIV